jgi:hypothetical protein
LRIAFALSMTRLRRASRVAAGHGSDGRFTVFTSRWAMTVDRLTLIPVALLAAATSWATASNCCVENGSAPRPHTSRLSWTHSFMFTPDATAALTVGTVRSGWSTSPCDQAAYLPGRMARTMEPSLSMYAVADGPVLCALLAELRSCIAVAVLAVWCKHARIVALRRRAAPLG